MPARPIQAGVKAAFGEQKLKRESEYAKPVSHLPVPAGLLW
jgi:hypothetical protein